MKKLILILLMVIPLKLLAPPSIKTINYKAVYIEELKQSELSLSNVRKYLNIMEIAHPEVVIKQFILETGWGKSYVCKTFNNLFGFRGSNGYFKYKHWTESVEHYKEFQNKKYKGGDYYNFLVKVGYAEVPDYIQILKQNFGKI